MPLILSNIASAASKDVLLFLSGQDCKLIRKLVADKADLRAYRAITILNATRDLENLNRFSGFRCEALKGNLHGYYSLRINQKWRLVFRVDQKTKQYQDIDINEHYE